MMMAMSYAVIHRTPSLQLIRPDTIMAGDVPLTSILPTAADRHFVEDRACFIVQSILQKYDAYMCDIYMCIKASIYHEHEQCTCESFIFPDT